MVRLTAELFSTDVMRLYHALLQITHPEDRHAFMKFAESLDLENLKSRASLEAATWNLLSYSFNTKKEDIL